MRNPYHPDQWMARKRNAFTLVELVVVMTVVAILSTAAIPSFRRTLERAKADHAAANLGAIWSAQQLFWLQNRTYADSLEDLQSLGVIDAEITSTTGDYLYAIESATDEGFVVRASRNTGSGWTGSLAITQSGLVSGSIRDVGLSTIVPSFK